MEPPPLPRPSQAKAWARPRAKGGTGGVSNLSKPVTTPRTTPTLHPRPHSQGRAGPGGPPGPSPNLLLLLFHRHPRAPPRGQGGRKGREGAPGPDPSQAKPSQAKPGLAGQAGGKLSLDLRAKIFFFFWLQPGAKLANKVWDPLPKNINK